MPEDSNIIKRSSLNALMAALSPVKEEAPRSYTAEIRRIDQDGVAWCRIFDADVDETPVENVTMTVKPGDIVGITIEDGVATANPSSESKLVSSSYMEAVMRGIAGDTSALEDYGYMDPLSVYDSTGNADMVFNSVTAISGNFQYLTAETARVGELVAGKVSTNYLRANYLDADYINTNYLTAQQIRTDYLDADYINANYLTSDYIQTNYLTAQQIRTDYLTAQQIQTDYLTAQQIRTDYMTANEIRANYLTANQIRTDYLDAEAIEAGYAHIDLENVNNSWIENGVIKNAAISDAQILGVSANKLTAGTIDASKINVANLRAKNLVVEKLNGQPVLGGYELVNPNGSGYSSKNPKSEGWYEYSNGTWTASTDTAVDSSKVYYKDAEQVSLYDQDYIDGLEHGLNQRIDGAVETFTGTAVPTMVNYPVSDWSDSEYQSHVGDIYYVVNQAAPEDGYCYRFAYDNTSKQYQWVLIKDSDVTKALSDISDLQTFESETNSWIEETDEGLRTIRQNHTSLSGVVDKTVKTSVQLWFTKADTTAPAAPTSKVTSTSTGGNAWTTAVPAWNASYPNYYYCWQYELVDGSYTWSAVVKDIAMGESQGTSRSAQSTANANIKSSTMLWFSKADSTTPAKPTSQVTSTSTDGNAWRLVVPTYNASYPYYFYCYQQQRGDGTYQWTDVVYDRATTESQSTARAASSSLANYITSNDAALQSLQDQVDGAVDIWYGTADPTSSTKPWDSGDADSIHEGDMYYNTTSGHVFRYVKNGSAYSWTQLPDSDAAAALAAAQDAQATADGKRRVFTAQPTPPYDVGDLWVRGTEVRYANKKRESGSYTASEWSLTSTDDTMAKVNIKSSVMLWFSKANSTAPAKPTSQVTSTGTGGNAWTTVVPTWNSSYPHYFYCYQQQKGDGTWQWTDVVYDRATSEAQQKAAAALPASTFTTFQSTTFKELVDEVDEQSSTITTMSERIDNIQVGGRNLLRWTANPTYAGANAGKNVDSTGWYSWTNAAGITDTEDGIKASFTANSTGFIIPFIDDDTVDGLTDYMLSFDYRGTVELDVFTVYALARSGSNWPTVASAPLVASETEWKHIEVAIRWPTFGGRKAVSMLMPYNATNGKWLEIRDGSMKLEKGNMPTDWSPAPEDVEASITTVSQTVNTVKQTADTNKASITNLTKTVSDNKTAIENRASSIEQTVDGIETDISSMRSEIDTKADGSTVTTLTTKVNNVSDTVDGHTQAIRSAISSTMTGPDVLTDATRNINGWTINAPAGANYTKSAYGTDGTTVTFSAVGGYENLYSPNISVEAGKSYTVSFDYAVGKSYTPTNGQGGYGLGVYDGSGYPGGAYDTSNTKFIAKSYICDEKTTIKQVSTVTFTARSNTVVLMFNGGNIVDGQTGLTFSFDNLKMVESVGSALSMLSEDYATFKSTVNEFEATVGTTYATKGELETEAKQRKAGFGVCTTAAATAAKAVTVSNFSLHTGATVTVRFDSGNTAAAPTLNVSGTGAKPIVVNGTASPTADQCKWSAYATCMFTYDGGQWRLVGTDEDTKRIVSAETSIKSNAEAISLRATKSEAYQSAQPNLSPMFSSHNEDGTYPDGGVGGFWQPSNDKYYNRSYFTALEDGWMHVEAANNAQKEFVPARVDGLKANDHVTLLVEWRNATWTGNGAAFYSRNYPNNVQLPANWTAPVNSASGEARTSYAVSSADGAQAWNGLIDWTFTAASSSTWTGDIRISFYKEIYDSNTSSYIQYAGPYKPYSGSQLYASQSELKVTADGISSTVSKIGGVKQLTSTTGSGWSLASIKAYALETATTNFNVSSTSDVRVGDMVYIKGYDNTRKCDVYIKGIVTAVNSATSVTISGRGYEDKIPVDSAISSINQSAEAIRIEAKRVEIDGSTVFRNSSTSTTTLSDYVGGVAQDKADAVKIGGRNYAITMCRDVSQTTNGVTVKQIGPSTIRLNGTTTALSSTANIVFRTPILKPGKYSLWLTNPGSGSGLVWFRLGVGSGNTHVYSSQGAFTKDNPYVFEVTSENYYAFYPVIANSTTFTNFETSFMLEAGNRPSSWTPAPEELQAPNLSPFFSFEPYNTVAGQGAQYWNSITDASHFTPMGDGWVKHVTRDNTSGTAVLYDQHRPKSMGSLDPEATYTLMVEFRNVSKTGNVYLRCPDSGQSGTAAISLNGVPNTSIDLAIANGIYYKVFKTAASTATNYSVFFGLCTRVDAGVKATYEMRLSIYEGVYYGPYQPYTGHAVTQEQRIYYRSNSKSAPTAPTTFVTANGTANTTWTTKRMPYDSTYKYLYTTMQRKYADGNTSCGPVLLDDTTTVIDGGNIITNTITANKLDADSINASKMLGVGSLADAAKKALDNSEIVIGGRNLFLNSGTPASWPRYITNEYEIARVYLSENLVKGDEYTIQVWGTVSRSDKTGAFHVYWGGGGVSLGVLTPNSARDYWVLTFTAPNSSNTQTSNAWLVLWNTPPQGASGTTYSATITKVKIEKGNKATDWSEAPEDTVGFKYLSSNYTNGMATVKSWAVEGKDAGNWTVSSTAGVHVGDTVYIKTVPSDNYNNPVYVILTVTSISSATVLKGISHGYLDTASTVSKNVVTTAIDFNDYKTSGMFYVKVSSNTNAPTTGHGLLEVNFDVGTPYQIWQPDSSSLEYYKRWYSSSTWSAWKKLDPNGAYNLASTANNKANAWRGTESGDMGAAAKTIACAGFTTDHLVQGTTVTAYCANSQGNAGTITLNVQGTGAYNVWVGNAVTSDTNRLLWLYGCTITFVFVGSASSGYWKIVDNPPAYYGATCTVAEGTASKTTVIDNAILYKGATLSVPMSNTNTASAMTLAVLNSSGTSIGANTVYHGASTNVPTKANGMAWPAGEAVIFTYDGKFWRTGNQTFVDGGHVVTGTISADRIQVSDIKIGDLNGYSALSTRVSSGESALTKVNYYNRYALAHQSTTLNTSKPWYKFASVNITTQNTDRVIKFDVMINGYGVTKYGTLVAHIRAGANIGSVEYHDFVWLDRNSAIFPAKFVMAYKLTSGTSLACELWCKLDEQGWHGFRFNQIYENGTEASPFWTLYQTSTNGSEAAITSGYTQQASVDASTAFLTRIDENGIRVHPASTENNRVEIKAAGMQVYKGGYLKANYADTITLYGGSNASGANPSVSLSSTDFKMLDSGGVQRIALNSTDGAIIGKPTQGHTQITDAGAYFYDTNNKKRSDITASGLQVYDTDGATSVASFGASVRVGKESLGHLVLDGSGIEVYADTNNLRQKIDTDGTHYYTTISDEDAKVLDVKALQDTTYGLMGMLEFADGHQIVGNSNNLYIRTGSSVSSLILSTIRLTESGSTYETNIAVDNLGRIELLANAKSSNTPAGFMIYADDLKVNVYGKLGFTSMDNASTSTDFFAAGIQSFANGGTLRYKGLADFKTWLGLGAMAYKANVATSDIASGTLGRARGGTGMTAIATTNFSNSGQSVANNTATDITFNSQAYFNFPSTGIFLMTCSVTFLSNATGLRAVCVNNTSKNVGLNYTDLNACSSPAVNGEPTKFVWTSLVNITDATQKWYMSVKHTAGAALTVRAYVRVVKIFAS